MPNRFSQQVVDEIKQSHDLFLEHLELLDIQLSRQRVASQQQHAVLRSVHAPTLARIALHTDALVHKTLHGVPRLGKELGRGYFGIVYECKSWANYSPCAIKILQPQGAREWKEVALQYHYTRLMGPHERIVYIHACVVEKNKGKGQMVWMVMDVHKCDLEEAIRDGLTWWQRCRIALDVVEGIRFLHSQGLIHRDIKPNNILLDAHGRAKVTDLDFCKLQAMMTGSVVGTPVHMAPELFDGVYDASVDVYAFGVLYWYLCSGRTVMPSNFCVQKNKEALSEAIKKGLRPERLDKFPVACWEIMEACWAPLPDDRILLGDLSNRLERMLQQTDRLDSSSANPTWESDSLCPSSEDEDGNEDLTSIPIVINRPN